MPKVQGVVPANTNDLTQPSADADSGSGSDASACSKHAATNAGPGTAAGAATLEVFTRRDPSRRV